MNVQRPSILKGKEDLQPPGKAATLCGAVEQGRFDGALGRSADASFEPLGKYIYGRALESEKPGTPGTLMSNEKYVIHISSSPAGSTRNNVHFILFVSRG